MSKARRKLKKGEGKSAKRPKPRKAKFITRAEARRLAARHVVKRLFKGATVRDGTEAILNIYNVRRKDTWVVSKITGFPGFRSSEVVIICKRTGRVLYDGPALAFTSFEGRALYRASPGRIRPAFFTSATPSRFDDVSGNS